MAANDPGVRKAVAAAGGRARAAKASPQALAAAGRAGAAGLHAPATLARRIVKAWPGLSQTERNEIRRILAAIL
jgi:hypothetical protein